MAGSEPLCQTASHPANLRVRAVAGVTIRMSLFPTNKSRGEREEAHVLDRACQTHRVYQRQTNRASKRRKRQAKEGRWASTHLTEKKKKKKKENRGRASTHRHWSRGGESKPDGGAERERGAQKDGQTGERSI